MDANSLSTDSRMCHDEPHHGNHAPENLLLALATQDKWLTKLSFPEGVTDIDRPSFVCLAWSMTEAQYQSDDTVIFDTVVCISSEAKLKSRWRPWEITLNTNGTVRDALSMFLGCVPESSSDQPEDLQNRNASSPSKQTLLIIYNDANGANTKMTDELLRQHLGSLSGNYTMAVFCRVAESSCSIGISRVDSHGISNGQCDRIARQFSFILARICEQPDFVTADLMVPNPEDMAEIMNWTQGPPETVESCVHAIIQRHAAERPDAVAISACDGDLTYGKLVGLAVQLAKRLIEKGISLETFVPLCFSKSKWTAVAMLGVSMAGGAFVLLEPSYPVNRLASICGYLKPPLIICSSDNADLAAELVSAILVLGTNDLEGPCNKPGPAIELPDVKPCNALYATFTSGSTGVPKGVVIEHRSYCSSAGAQIMKLRLGPLSRVIQFSSYAFDMSILEALHTLMAGGCICVLGDSERLDNYIASAQKYAPTHAYLTPSFARAIPRYRLDQLGLQVVIIAGERVDPYDLACVTDRVQLMNGYGPAECSPLSSIDTDLRAASHVSSIGQPAGVSFWVASPHDTQRLTPVGGVGELLIEGPPVGREYLGDVSRTRAAFIEPPTWLCASRHSRMSPRVYKTGDLVKRQADGTWLFVGRKDTQVKIRGQRVELQDIEQHVRGCFEGAMDVVAEVISSSNSVTTTQSSVVTFLLLEMEGDQHRFQDTPFAWPTEEFLTASQRAKETLRKALPRHMVPSLFVSLAEIPRTNSGKTDRRKLRESFEGLRARGELGLYNVPAEGQNDPPLNGIQETLQAIWAQVLNLPRERVLLHSSFFDLGGDSVSAIHAAASARSSGLHVKVSDIFDHPILTVLSSMVSFTPSIVLDRVPFSLMELFDPTTFFTDLRERGMLPGEGEVTDMVPTTPFQREMLDSACFDGNFFSYHGAISIDSLRAACEAVWARHSMLRTVFVSYRDTVAQVILSNMRVPLHHIITENLNTACQSILEKLRQRPLLGQVHTQFTLLSNIQMQQHIFFISLCHAQCDAASVSSLISDIATAYRGVNLAPGPDFQDYVYLQNRYQVGQARSFWREYLDGASMARVPDLSQFPDSNHECRSLSIKRPGENGSMTMPAIPSGITLATLVKAAWAFCLAESSGESDIVFGQFVNGRNLPLSGIDEIVGPCVKELPLRVTVQASWTVREYLAHVHTQHRRTLSFDYLDLPDIVEHCTSWPKGTWSRSRILHQNVDQSWELPLPGTESQSSWVDEVFTGKKDMWVHSCPKGQKLHLFLSSAHEGIMEIGPPLLESVYEMVGLLSQNQDLLLGALAQRH